MPPKTQVNSSTGIMGPTGSGKSSLAATLADYLWERWRKVLLYYVSDGGGYPAEVQARIAIGLIRVFRMQTRDPGDLGLAFETCYRAAQGWWPKRINPATGEVEPGVEMIPPIAKVWEVSCSKGHLMRKVQSQNLIKAGFCQQCGKAVPAVELMTKATVIRSKGFEDVGGGFYDGLTSMLAWELRELGHRAGRLELKGEEAAIGGKVSSGDLKFGGVTRSHVGFAQTRGEELVHLALGIPNLMVPPVFTMLTHEDVDDRSLSIRGPKIAGRAKTDEAPQWFGNMLETAKVPSLQGSSGEQRVLYLSEFTDQNGVKHLLKHRGSPGTMPDLLADPPGDDPATSWSQVNLGVFFRLLDQALDVRIDQVKEQFPDAPGLPDGVVEYGDPALQMPKPSPQVPAVAAPQTLRVPGGAAAPAPRPVAAAPAPTTALAPPAATQAPAAAPVAAAPTQISGPGAPVTPKARAPRKATAAVRTAGSPAPAPAPAPAPPGPNGQGETVRITTADIGVIDAAALVGPAAPSPTPPTPRPTPPPPSAAPTPRPTGAPAPRSTAAPPVGARPAVAPPPGQRPPGSAPAAQARPPVATAAGARVPAQPPAAQTSPALRPAGVTTASPTARPPAAAPRPPAAAPRPPAPTPPVQ